MLFVRSRTAIRQRQWHYVKLRTLAFQQLAFARLVSSLAVLEQREGRLQNASLSAVTAAQKVGGPITGFVAGSGIKAVAEEAAKVKGLDKVIKVENDSYDRVRALCRIICGYSSNISLGSPRELCPAPR